MATNERSVELAGVNLAGQNHVCAFFNTMEEEHRESLFVPPDQFLEELRERRSTRMTAGS
jgi:hypothetical protein